MTWTQQEISFKPGGEWKIYCVTLPLGAVGLGVITIGKNSWSLLRLRNNTLVRFNAGVFSSLPNDVVFFVCACLDP
jgi:hypothetical protein